VTRSSLQNALKVYQTGPDKEFRKGEIARTYYKLALTRLKMKQNAIADKDFARAEALRKELVSADSVLCGESLYDSLVSVRSL
jgi:hypothetical protein